MLAHDWGSVQLWDVVCQPNAELRVASFTSVSGPSLDHMGAMLHHNITHPTPANLAPVARQLVASGYTFFFQIANDGGRRACCVKVGATNMHEASAIFRQRWSVIERMARDGIKAGAVDEGVITIAMP